jgi:DNA-binding XRE family transcriptional regulator
MSTLSAEHRAKLEVMRGKPPRLAKVIKPKDVQPISVAELEETVEKMIALQALGEGLKLARQRRHLTTRQLASALGVSQSRVVHIEQANENLEMQTVTRVAKKLGFRVLVQFIPENVNEAAISVNMPPFEANV